MSDFAASIRMKDEEINIILGKLIRDVRKEQGMKQTDLADCMGVDFQLISAYERGRRNPGINFMIRLCRCMKVDFGEFMTELNRRLKEEG